MAEQHSHVRHTQGQRSERASAENQKSKGQGHDTDRQVPGEAPCLSTAAPSLLGNPSLKGRGNESARIALMRQMQKTYGNRATRTLLQRAAATFPTTMTATSKDTTPGTSAAIADTLSSDPYSGYAGTSLVIQRMKADEVQVGKWYKFKNDKSGQTLTGKLLEKRHGGWYKFNNGRAHGAANILSEASAQEEDEEEDSEQEKAPRRSAKKVEKKRKRQGKTQSASNEPSKKRQRKNTGDTSEKVVDKMVEKDQPKNRVATMGRLGERNDKVQVRKPGSGTNEPGFVDTNKFTSSFAGIDAITEGKLTQSKVHDPTAGDKAAIESHKRDIKKLPRDAKNTVKQLMKPNPHTHQTYGEDLLEINEGKKTTPSNSQHGKTRKVAPHKAHHKNVLPQELAEQLQQKQPDTKKMEATVAKNMVYTVASDLAPSVKKGLKGVTVQVGSETIDLASKVEPKAVTVREMRDQAERVEERMAEDSDKEKEEDDSED